MERKALSFLLMFVIIGSFTGQSDAWFKHFKNCMKTCLIDCAIPPWTVPCPFRCLAKCTVQGASQTNTATTHQFCTFGCASSKCSKLISKDNYRLDEVESCVDECSKTCDYDHDHDHGPAN